MAKKYKGIEIRSSKTISINFTYQGKQKKDTLEIKPTESNVSMVNSLLIKLRELEKNDLLDSESYLKLFPYSKKRGSLFDDNYKLNAATTLQQAFDFYFLYKSVGASKKSKSTYKLFAKRACNFFGGDTPLRKIKHKQCEEYRLHLIDKMGLGLVRQKAAETWNYFASTTLYAKTSLRLIDVDPAENFLPYAKQFKKFKNQSKSTHTVNPFLQDEIQKVLSNPYKRPTVRAMFLLGCFTGLSKQELQALAVEDINMDARTLTVNRAFTDPDAETAPDGLKQPKNEFRGRTIDLSDQAYKVVKEQLLIAMGQTPRFYEVADEDNTTMIKQRLRFFFPNEKAQRTKAESRAKKKLPYFTAASYDRAFATMLDHYGIDQRSPNQLRHTYASWALTKGMQPQQLATILGQTSTEMIYKHYGKILESLRESTREQVTNIFSSLNN